MVDEAERAGVAGLRRPMTLAVDVRDLRRYNAGLMEGLIEDPANYLTWFDESLADAWRALADTYNPKVAAAHSGGCAVQLVGNLGGGHHLTPRQLLAPQLNRLVCVEGVVTRCGLVRPKVQQSAHYCDATKQFTQREYRDVTSHQGLPTGSVYPTKDDAGNLLTTEYGMCVYRDSQHVTVQDSPEDSQAGQMPRSIEIVLEGGLVDACKPGDRVKIVGIFKTIPIRASGTLNGTFKTVVVGNSVSLRDAEAADPQLTPRDIQNIKALAKRRDCLNVLSESLAPAIFGHGAIKRACLLQLLGGVEKNLKNGTHIRGDVNVLMVGDPGVAKSQMLRATMNVAPLAVSTTGRSTTGVGLTAAVLTDPDTGDRRLEAGAMVLADRGLVCIDEFDKMSEADRVAIHEVMEQQTVTISKAGIHSSLNARCSVLAAANPVMGMYDHSQSVAKNVALPDSLLSRFDLLFIVLDKMTQQSDRAVSSYVLDLHQHAPTGAEAAALADGRAQAEKQGEAGQPSPVFAGRNGKISDMLGPNPEERPRAGTPVRAHLSIEFLKKFLFYAKKHAERRAPALSAEARARVAAHYVDLRSGLGSGADAKPVTVRTLETFIRLATAHAKVYLQRAVTAEDVDAAMALMNHSVGDADEAKPKRKRKRPDSAAPEAGTGAASEAGAAPGAGPAAEVAPAAVEPAPEEPAAEASEEQKKAVRAALNEIHDVLGTMVPVENLVEHLAGAVPAPQVRAVLRELEAEGKIMLGADSTQIYII